MFYRLAHELIRKNRNGSSDRALICEVRLGRVIVLLADGGRETFSVEHGAGWSYAPGPEPDASGPVLPDWRHRRGRNPANGTC